MKIKDRLSDVISKGIGTWYFVGILSTITALWIGWNVHAPKAKRFDPYPFVALNLCYSFLAGYTAPILLMSANRQGELDRERMMENLELERQDNKNLHAMMHRIISLEQDIEDAMKLRAIATTVKQPEWVCTRCGEKYGLWWQSNVYSGPTRHDATFHVDDCRVCGEHVPCTEARDFGYLVSDWVNHNKVNE